MAFGKEAGLTWCRNGNVSRVCFSGEGRELPGPVITDGNGEDMMPIGLRTASG
jgi:hypothetical protein